MRPKFRVWCEYTIEGVKHAEMAGPENWFLLSQCGTVMSHSLLGGFDPNDETKYDKLVVEFWTGLKDKNGHGQDIYDGDKIVRGNDEAGYVVQWRMLKGQWWLREYKNHLLCGWAVPLMTAAEEHIQVCGTIHDEAGKE